MRRPDTDSNLEAELNAYAAANPGTKSGQWREHLSRWPAYAAATGAALAMATSAEANTIVTGYSGQDIFINVSSPPTSARTRVQFGTLGALNFALGFSQHNAEFTLGSTGVIRVFANHAGTSVLRTGDGLLARFNAGSVISNGLPRGYSAVMDEQKFRYFIGCCSITNAGIGVWPASNTGFLGFQLPSGDLGWVQVEWTGANRGFPDTMDAMEWGVNTVPGQSLDAGQTYNPEPGTLPLSLLALGPTGILAWRKTRRNRRGAAEAWRQP